MKYFCALLIILGAGSCWSVLEESASLKEFMYGSAEQCAYDNWLSHVSEGIVTDNYNLYAPYDQQNNSFGGFNQASSSELNIWETALGYMLDGDLESTEWYLDLNDYPFQVVEFHDTDTDRTYYMIRESLNNDYDNNGTAYLEDDENGSFDFGWGIHIFNPEASNPIIMSVVHPCDDFIAPPLAIECFQEWDAMFLQINGAGREVAWTEQGSYTNSKSLSDPSRNTNHAFTQAYYLFCDKIREVFGRREFSPQIHSYDWNRHAGYANCQISAGYSEECPNLPIRDMSDLKLDLINASSHLIHEAGTIGDNAAVYLNDFYAVHYSEYDFEYVSPDTVLTVNSNVDLVGYSQNRQMLYSFAGWNSYDVFEPFFHLEMDELPNCYSQIISNLRWFYAYNTDTNEYEMDQIFDNVILYYRPYVEAVQAVLPALFEMNDQAIPSSPAGLNASFMGFNEIEVSWEPISSYDFKTYEVYYNTDHITDTTFTSYNRFDAEILASPDQSFITIPELLENQQYYFKIRAIDYNDNYSQFSPEVYSITAPAVFSQITAVGEDDESLLSWELESQSGILGFRIYRKTADTEFTVLDDYHNNLELLGGNDLGDLYQYVDLTAENEIFYTYKISSINQAAYEYIYEEEAECSPREIYFLEFYDANDTMLDEIAFAANPYASDEYDEGYDIIKPDSLYNGVFSAAFFESNWITEDIYLSREIHEIYDPADEYETWTVKVRTHLVEQPLHLKVSDNYDRNVEKLYLYSYSSGEIADIAENELEFTVPDTHYVTFTLIWGDLLPTVYFTNQPNRIYQENDSLLIDWNINYPVMVDQVDLFVSNYEDSLWLATDIPGDVTSFNWMVPAGITMHDARFGLNIYTVHDELFLRTSPFLIGLLPLEQTLLPEAGWQMVTNPWVDNHITISEDFSNRTELYRLEGEFEYLLTDTMNFAQGYWLNTLSPAAYTDDSVIQKAIYFKELEPGWNLLANPHLCSYEIEDLRFELVGDDFSFSQSINNEFISRAVYAYRSEEDGEIRTGSYQLIDEIRAKEAFWLYCYADIEMEPYCIFKPYNNSYFVFPDPATQIVIDFDQDLGDSDQMVIGLRSQGDDEFEYKYDLPEPPAKPVNESIAAYLTKDTAIDTTFKHARLNWEYRPELSQSELEEAVWDFALDVNEAGDVAITASFLDVPDDYTVNLAIGAFNAELEDAETIVFTALNSGHFVGTITISNGREENTATAKSTGFASYPNPFNPQTTLIFNLKEDSDVKLQIYNIRGQLVRTLHNGWFTKGDYKVVWNGRNEFGKRVSSGLYFASFRTNRETQITKLLLLK